MTVKNLYPTLRPSLDLNFARAKSLDPRVSFTRGSIGTYVGADGLIKTVGANVPRFDYSPTTGESLGLLVEEQRTNLALWSQVIRLSEWPFQQATFQSINQAVAPDGTNTANTLTENSQLANRFISQSIAVTNTAHTWSVFAKTKERRRIMLRESSVSGAAASFDTTLGTVVGTEAGATATITAYPNGWFRCSITYTPSAASSRLHAVYVLPDSGTSFATASYQGDSTSGIYLWGAQLEAGAFPTSYIPTVASTVTRAADVASITGAAFSSWYNQTEGTVFFEGVMAPVLSRFPPEWTLSDGTDTNQINAYNYTGGYGITVRQSGQANTDPLLLVTPVSGAAYKKAVAIKVSDYRVAAQGQQAASTNPAFMPTVSQFQIGTSRTGTGVLNSTIKRIAYWPVRLPNATLQQLTQS